MKYEISDLVLCVFPIVLLAIQFVRVQVAPKDNFIEDYWSLEPAKSVQGLAAAYIILHHLTQMVTQYGAIDRGPVTILQSVGIYFVSIFFFFSGYGLVTSYRTKNNYLDGFLVKRLSVLLVPFVITNIIYVFTVGFYSERIQCDSDLISSLLGYTLINTNAWYVVEILFLYIVFYLAYRPKKKKATNEKVAFTVVAVFTLLMIAVSLLLGHDHTMFNGHWFMGEWWYNTTILFVVGMAFASGGEKLQLRLQKHYTKWFVLCAIMCIVFFVVEQKVIQMGGYYQEWDGHPGYFEKAITLLVQSVACVAFVVFLLLVMMKLRFKNRITTFLGSVSFEVYLIHDLFRTYVGGDYSSYQNRRNLMQPWKLYIIVLVLSYVSAFILHKLDAKVIRLLQKKK